MEPQPSKDAHALTWQIERRDAMRVPGVFTAVPPSRRTMGPTARQLVNVASLPGVIGACYGMPGARAGRGFPIGGVAAFDPDRGGVVCVAGVGVDIACGIRVLLTTLAAAELALIEDRLEQALTAALPTGTGESPIRLSPDQVSTMLVDGARWAVAHGWGTTDDLTRVEERGRMHGARPACVSPDARGAIRTQLGTLGGGNHGVTVHRIARIWSPDIANALGIDRNSVAVSVHCGSRGLGRQTSLDYARDMAAATRELRIGVPDPDLVCAPIRSTVGQAYLGAMRAAINCAFANRQLLTHRVRAALRRVAPGAGLRVLYDLSHNTCKIEEHAIDGELRQIFVHRRGATRAFGPGHRELAEALRPFGQPVFIADTSSDATYVMVGRGNGGAHGFGSSSYSSDHRRVGRTAQLVRTLETVGIARRVALLEPVFRIAA